MVVSNASNFTELFDEVAFTRFESQQMFGVRVGKDQLEGGFPLKIQLCS